LMATALMASEGMRSVVVAHTGVGAVKSLVCQTPPLTVAANTCLGFAGSTARALTAPTDCVVAGAGPMTLAAFWIGPGPTAVHVAVAPERSARASNRSRRGRNRTRVPRFLGRRPFRERPGNSGESMAVYSFTCRRSVGAELRQGRCDSAPLSA